MIGFVFYLQTPQLEYVLDCHKALLFSVVTVRIGILPIPPSISVTYKILPLSTLSPVPINSWRINSTLQSIGCNNPNNMTLYVDDYLADLSLFSSNFHISLVRSIY